MSVEFPSLRVPGWTETCSRVSSWNTWEARTLRQTGCRERSIAHGNGTCRMRKGSIYTNSTCQYFLGRFTEGLTWFISDLACPSRPPCCHSTAPAEVVVSDPKGCHTRRPWDCWKPLHVQPRLRWEQPLGLEAFGAVGGGRGNTETLPTPMCVFGVEGLRRAYLPQHPQTNGVFLSHLYLFWPLSPAHLCLWYVTKGKLRKNKKTPPPLDFRVSS